MLPRFGKHILTFIYFFPQEEDRRSLLRGLSDEAYRDVIRVLAMMPLLTIKITTEVVDDEDQHVVTAGAIITVTIAIERK